ncbi:MAG: helix-turn-helix domain-containing protein [Bacteroidetes bacterium]|nr:helix-turn-helix domain-containing protein [Bacteroidota bacterium]
MKRINPSQSAERLSVSVEEAARMLGVCRGLVFRLLREGQLKSVRIGKRRLIPAEELKAFLQRECAVQGVK